VVELGLPLARPLDAGGYESIQLSAADLSAIQSLELSALEELTSRVSDVAGNVAGNQGLELSTSDFETLGWGKPAAAPAPQPAPPRIAATQPMLATDPIIAPPREPPVPVAVRLTPWAPPVAQPPPPVPLSPRTLRARIIVVVAVVGAGVIFAIGWLSDSPDSVPSESTSAKGTPIAAPSSPTRLIAPPARHARPGNRTR
jgi:hypothetical protein